MKRILMITGMLILTLAWISPAQSQNDSARLKMRQIIAAIKAPCGARTVDGVNRRTRAGMGRCQGGFCGPRVTAILARELDIPVTEVRKERADSYMFYDKLSGICEVDNHE